MASITKVVPVSIATPAPDPEHSLSGLYAGEAIAGGDACYIKTSDGKLYRAIGGGVAAPAGPALATAGAGGTILAGLYEAVITYVTPSGESGPSQVSDITTVGTTSTITVTSPSASGAATAYKVYMSPPNGGPLALQNGAGGTAIGTPLTLTAPPVTGTALPPTANTSGGTATAVDGFAACDAAVGDPLTLYYGIRFQYGAGLSPGTFVYLDTVAGGLSDAPTATGTVPIGRVIDATRIDLRRSY